MRLGYFHLARKHRQGSRPAFSKPRHAVRLPIPETPSLLKSDGSKSRPYSRLL